MSNLAYFGIYYIKHEEDRIFKKILQSNNKDMKNNWLASFSPRNYYKKKEEYSIELFNFISNKNFVEYCKKKIKDFDELKNQQNSMCEDKLIFIFNNTNANNFMNGLFKEM